MTRSSAKSAEPSIVDQAALFHLLNLAREQAADLLLTARTQPAGWTLQVKDLASRLRAVPVIRHWPGAETIYDTRWIHEGPAGMAAAIAASSDEQAWQRAQPATAVVASRPRSAR